MDSEESHHGHDEQKTFWIGIQPPLHRETNHQVDSLASQILVRFEDFLFISDLGEKSGSFGKDSRVARESGYSVE
ncbi:MAG: hypothetical protein PHI73_00720 [Patescibacteria group bacterium]|nr:hypothetical protein [Patescibacteria group bacterium]